MRPPFEKTIITVLALGASLLVSAGASAGQSVTSAGHDRIVFATAHAGGTNGYRVIISGAGNSVTIFASHGRESVTYTVKGRAGGERIRGDFGTLGSVNLRFHPRRPAGRAEEPPPIAEPCHSDEATRRGVWEGEVRFVGEGGFTSLSETKLLGKVETITFDCEIEPALHATGHRPERPILFTATASDRDAQTGTFLTALRSDFQDIARVVASSQRRVGDVLAGYSIDRNVPRNTLRVNRQRTRFHLDGTPPFTGEASFKARHQHRGRWAGDLAVTLPVIGQVALTGPGFRASLRG